MKEKFDAIRLKANELKNKLFCQSVGHIPADKEEQEPNQPNGRVKVTTLCARCGTQMENPFYRWK